jgi:hypothetical protein
MTQKKEISMPTRDFIDPRKFARVGGIIMLALGVLALIPGLYRAPIDLPALRLDASYGSFLGFIPMNIINKLVLIAFGIAGITCANSRDTSLPSSINWSRVVCVTMGVLAVLGIFRGTNTLGGYYPLFGANIAIYALASIVAGYFGWSVPAIMRRHTGADVTHIRAA